MVVVSNSIDYTAKIEHFTMNGEPAKTIHCTVHNWSPSIYKQMLKDWEEFRKQETDLLYAFPPTDQVAKFAEKFGFYYSRHCRGGTNPEIKNHRPLYLHRV